MDPLQIPLLQQQLVATLQLFVSFSPAMGTEDLIEARIRLTDANFIIAQTIIDRESAATDQSRATSEVSTIGSNPSTPSPVGGASGSHSVIGHPANFNNRATLGQPTFSEGQGSSGEPAISNNRRRRRKIVCHQPPKPRSAVRTRMPAGDGNQPVTYIDISSDDHSDA